MFNVNGNMFNWSKILKSLKYRFCFSMWCQINYTNLLQSVGFHNRGESEGATKGVAYLHPQQNDGGFELNVYVEPLDCHDDPAFSESKSI